MPHGVLFRQALSEARSQFGSNLEYVNLNAFVFQRSPQTLDKRLVHPANLTIRSDLDIGIEKLINKVWACELAALVNVEDVRRAVFGNGLLQCPHAKVSLH
jgi:hypothetical protein